MTSAAALGLVDRRRAGWGLALKGAAIIGQGGIAEMVAHHHHFYADLADPVRLMRGDSPTELARFWTYAAGPKTDDADADAAGYTALMAASQAFVASAVLHNRIFRRVRHLADLGGGAAAFAIAALRRHPKLTATVCDRSDVVPHARQAIVEAGLSKRADARPLNFFEDAPPAEADLLTLVRICHDHDDEAVARLLTNLARQAPKTPLAVIEPMADQRNPSGLDVYFPWYFRAMGQGRYRTRAELQAFLAAAGYRRVRPLHSRNPTLVRGLLVHVTPD
jgi:demethylspheroidene O-methyltransferase